MSTVISLARLAWAVLGLGAIYLYERVTEALSGPLRGSHGVLHVHRSLNGEAARVIESLLNVIAKYETVMREAGYPTDMDYLLIEAQRFVHDLRQHAK